jgi:Ferredoxin subunits of nitrite reductase and ring-hydroxylating dioxygenases
MSGFTEVARKGELQDGEMRKVCIGERELLIALAGGRYYCAENRCPHLGGDLSRGTLAGAIVTCPDHFSEFDLASGAVIRWTNLTGIVARIDRQTRPPKPISVYEVKVEGDLVFARLP